MKLDRSRRDNLRKKRGGEKDENKMNTVCMVPGLMVKLILHRDKG